ncbi:ATP-binding cassette domain-containing protein [Planctomycetes bacterium K23_9]|uniref:L-cystine import ATP-binding protein TcyC n=1 Tax=Stieleria marina TaxID=1930275 RepID=A0A517NPY8_9BACT|nr:L-cystine import ATP-binding protein TcyC [Planctomycetes bacterium K23_9]
MAKDAASEKPKRIPVMEMRDVTLREFGRESRLRRINLQLYAGELAFILRPTGPTKQLLPGGALGLITPRRGEVRFSEVRWRSASREKQREMRAKIGRVFDHSGWLQNLSVIDNILLAQRHHTDRSEHELFAHARSLVGELGVPFPDRRPAFVDAWKLRLYQWVRALICQPLLLIAERPFAGVPKEFRERVFAVEKRFRERGGATIWVTDNRNLWNKVHSTHLAKYEIIDERFIPQTGAA